MADLLLGCHTSGFSSHALPAAIDVIAGLGFRGVAITLDHHALDPYGASLAEEIGRARARLRAAGLRPVVETGARFLLDPWRKHRPTLVDRDPAARARRADFLRRAIAIAGELEAGVVSVWSGAVEDGAEPPDAIDARLCDELGALLDRARRAGVTLAFEPEPGMWIEDLAGWRRLHAALPALRLTLDVGHAHLTEPAGAAGCIAEIAGVLANVHLEGMRRGAHEHLEPHEGDLDLAGAIAALRTAGYRGPANLELSRHSHDAVAAARRALAFFRPLGLP